MRISRFAVIIGNGEAPPKDVLRKLCNTAGALVLCADGGLRHLLKAGIVPHVVLGDFDSVNAKDLEKLPPEVLVKKMTGQEDTDIEKCIKFAIAKRIKKAYLFAASGGRLDHTVNNLSLLERFTARLRLLMITQEHIIEVVSGNVKRKVTIGSPVSFFPLSKKVKVLSTGLEFDLPGFKMTPGVNNSTSNLAKADNIVLKISGGKMLLFTTLKGSEIP